jgi:hypothetical protein
MLTYADACVCADSPAYFDIDYLDEDVSSSYTDTPILMITVDNVLLIIKRSLSIVIDKPIPLSIAFPIKHESLIITSISPMPADYIHTHTHTHTHTRVSNY